VTSHHLKWGPLTLHEVKQDYTAYHGRRWKEEKKGTLDVKKINFLKSF
jgi:hypothetical protein